MDDENLRTIGCIGGAGASQEEVETLFAGWRVDHDDQAHEIVIATAMAPHRAHQDRSSVSGRPGRGWARKPSAKNVMEPH